jgi:hypothetical protein
MLPSTSLAVTDVKTSCLLNMPTSSTHALITHFSKDKKFYLKRERGTFRTILLILTKVFISKNLFPLKNFLQTKNFNEFSIRIACKKEHIKDIE